MPPREAKQVRFTKLVSEAGKPSVYTPWMDPAKDPAFQKALREKRILTIDRVTGGTKKDAGEVGYAPREHALYLIFPRSVKGHQGRKVIGLNYELLDEPERPEPQTNPKPSRFQTVTARPKGGRVAPAKK